jgi:hypothetical protein
MATEEYKNVLQHILLLSDNHEVKWQNKKKDYGKKVFASFLKTFDRKNELK